MEQIGIYVITYRWLAMCFIKFKVYEDTVARL